MKRVFIAGPMSTSGEPGPNLHQAAVIAAKILQLGHAPYVPQVTWVLDAIAPTPMRFWLASDLAWLKVCDAVLRLPGDSRGADNEVAFAESNGIPVFFFMNYLREWLEKGRV